MTWQVLTLLFTAGLLAGFIDAIAGGGGLISVPALLWAGLPPQVALGTNKVQAVFGTAMAVRKYAQAKLVKWREMKLAVLVTFASAMLGTWVVTRVTNEVLKHIIPWLLLGIAVYVMLSPRMGTRQTRARLSLTAFSFLAGGMLGFYDGFFGPGTGAFWTLACLSLLGLDLPGATAFTKVVNLASNVASVLVFVVADRVNYQIAAVMIVGQLIGGRLGAGLAVRHGAPFIRVVFLTVVLGMVLKLLWDQFGVG